MLRREGYQSRLTLLDGEAEVPDDRTNLSKSFSPDDEQYLPLRPAGLYADHSIDLVQGEVTSLNVRGRHVLLADGSAHPYEALLLAAGAEPVRLDIPGPTCTCCVPWPTTARLGVLLAKRRIYTVSPGGASYQKG